MHELNIKVRNKIAAQSDKAEYVCGNSDYIAVFDFDSEWDAYDTKTARFSYNDSYTDVVFDGNQCPVPIITNTHCFHIGVYAGDLHTTTAARVPCRKSILCGGGIETRGSLLVSNEVINNIEKANRAQIQSVTNIVNAGYDNVIAAIGNMFGKKETVLATAAFSDFDENGVCFFPGLSLGQLESSSNVQYVFRIKTNELIKEKEGEVILLSDDAFYIISMEDTPILFCHGINPMTEEAYDGCCFATDVQVESFATSSLECVRIDYKKIPIEYVDTTDIEAAVNSITDEVLSL